MSLNKIHTRIVIDSMTGKVEEDEFYWHDTDKDGPISQLGGGGGGDGDAEAADFGEAGDMGETDMGGGGGYTGGADVADFAGPGPSGSPGTGGPVGPSSEADTSLDDHSDPGAGGPPGGHPDHGMSGVGGPTAGSGMESATGGAASMGLSGTSGGGATSSFGDFGGLIDPTWGWGIDDAATYGYGHGLTPAGKLDWPEGDDEVSEGGGEPPPGGTPAPAPGAPAPGAPGVVGGPLPGSIIPPWWSGSPHAEYEWGRYGTPYAIPSPRWEGGYDVPGHLTGYMPHYEGLLENAYTYPDIKALGLIYGAPPPAPAAEEEDDDGGEEEESGGEGGDPVE